MVVVRTSDVGQISERPEILCARRSMKNKQNLLNNVTPWGRVLEKLTVRSSVNKFPSFHGTLKLHNDVHKSRSPVPILSQMNPTYFSKSHFNIILPFIPRYSEEFLAFRLAK